MAVEKKDEGGWREERDRFQQREREMIQRDGREREAAVEWSPEIEVV